jgi:hypothetical protein
MTPTQHSTEEFKEATGLIYDSTLPTEKVCTLLDIPVPTLTRWVKKGVIKPRVHGAKGRGMTHRFDYRQCLALATISVLSQSLRPPNNRGISDIYQNCQSHTDVEWAGFLDDLWCLNNSDKLSRAEKERQVQEFQER